MKRTVLWLPTHPSEGGFSMDRYWSELEREFDAVAPREYEIYCPLGRAPAKTRKAPRFLAAWRKYFAYPRLAARQRAPVAHVLDHSYAHLLSHLPPSTFKIVTLHDQLTPLRDPGHLSASQVRRYRKVVECLRHADLLVANSQITARDVSEQLKIDPAKIKVSLLGVDLDLFTTKPAAVIPELAGLGAAKKILSVGSVIARKNLRIVPGTLRFMREKVGDIAFVRAGEMLPDELRKSILEVLPANRLVELGPRFGGELAAVYWSADVFFFPSYLEGFGLPVLEAMAAGRPVVCSNASSIPEVGGDAALYFEFDQPAQAAAQLIRVLAEPRLREEMAASGRSRVAGMSWRNHALFLSQCYEEALSAAEKK